MSRLQIAGFDIPAGEKKQGWFDVPGTELSIPCTLIAGAGDGRTVLVTAGIHCAEYIGIEAAVELSRFLRPAELNGNVIILPLTNRSGFEHRTMSMVYEDGKNLNRVFPGDPEGSTAERLAHALMENFIRHTDAYIDLHSGDGYEQLTPYVYYVGDTSVEETSREMVRCVDVPYVVRSNSKTGGGYNVASASGIPSILIERGGMGQTNFAEVTADMEDVCNLLRHFGVLNGDPKYRDQQEFTRVIYEDAPVCGCWYPTKQAGERFKRGEVLGEIRDYFGNVQYTYRAKAQGLMLYQTASLTILNGGPMVAYGVLEDM